MWPLARPVRWTERIAGLKSLGSHPLIDHYVHYYDLRNVREPVRVFKGHRKAVSYVKFLNRDEVVSAFVIFVSPIISCVLTSSS